MAAIAIAYAFSVSFDKIATGQAARGNLKNERPTSLSQFVVDSHTLFTFGFTIAILVVIMNGLFYRGTLTFLPDVLSDFLPDAAEQLQLYDHNSPMTEEFNSASYLSAGLLVMG